MLGASRRIVSTTRTSAGGFAPLLRLAGGDFRPPLAVVIAGGVGPSVVPGLAFTSVACPPGAALAVATGAAALH